jgi:prepilin-type N-terminal cleavage/methylation domain-containing protein
MAVMRKQNASSGFSLIEVMMAVVVLAAGLLSILGLFVFSLSTMQTAQEDLIAREKAKEALESVASARDNGQITYAQIQNVASGGLFDPNPQPIYLSCNNTSTSGIINTADYVAKCAPTIESVQLPGPDGVFGTPDDITLPLTNFTRRVTITNITTATGAVNPNLRQLQITVTYVGQRGGKGQYTVTSYISRFH